MHSARSTYAPLRLQSALCTAVCIVHSARSTQTTVCFVHAPLRLQSALCTLHSDCRLQYSRLPYSRLQSAALYSTLSIHSTVLKPWRNYNNKLLKTPRLSLFKDFVTVALWYRVSLQGYLTRVRIPLRVPRHAADRRSLAVQTRGMPRHLRE